MSNVSMSKYSDFNNKKFLVVDDFPEFRTAIKRMVEAFGGIDIDTCSNGEDAMSKIKTTKYDAILCDYNLGEGKDGQQVLEEGKYLGVINEWQVFILLTAENTSEMVMGALEYEPDGYLIKPFNKEMVHSRLMKIVDKKRELSDIYKAIQGKDIDRAIKICDENIAQGGRTVLPFLKLKGSLLLEKKLYKEAEQLYNSLYQNRSTAWILMGLGKSQYYQENYDRALETFEKILDISNVNVEAMDWIAKAQIKLDRPVEAQTTLERAVQLSSKAILRQQFLGDIAFENQDHEVAEKAYKAAVALGKFSCYRRIEDYTNYAKILIHKAKHDDHGRNSLRAGNDAIVALETLSNLYRSDRKIQAISCVLLSAALLAVSRRDKARVYAKKALNYVEKEHVKVEKEDLVMLGEVFVAIEEPEIGEKLINDNKHE